MKRILSTCMIVGGIASAVILGTTAHGTTDTYSLWHSKPIPAPTTSLTVTPAPNVTSLIKVTHVINKMSYTISVNRQSLGVNLDGYTVTITTATKTYLNLQLTKSEAQHVVALVQTYKPNNIQTLIARILVLALF